MYYPVIPGARGGSTNVGFLTGDSGRVKDIVTANLNVDIQSRISHTELRRRLCADAKYSKKIGGYLIISSGSIRKLVVKP